MTIIKETRPKPYFKRLKQSIFIYKKIIKYKKNSLEFLVHRTVKYVKFFVAVKSRLLTKER